MKKEEFLAMSLPFGLKGIDAMGDIAELIIFDKNGYFGTDLDIEEDAEELSNLDGNFLPILRPLSDLTKPIEHNGEKFVPIERILGLGKKDGDASSPWNYKILINDNNLIRIELVRSQQTLELNFRDLSLKHAMLLIDWHFDIAGLIEKGEAIDVNTLPENPYK